MLKHQRVKKSGTLVSLVPDFALRVLILSFNLSFGVGGGSSDEIIHEGYPNLFNPPPLTQASFSCGIYSCKSVHSLGWKCAGRLKGNRNRVICPISFIDAQFRKSYDIYQT